MSQSASVRRQRFGLQTVVLFIALTAAAGFALFITSRVSVQLDDLATRDHVLSARTRATLERLDGEYDIVVAANLRLVDPTSAQRTIDTLDTFDRASDKISFTVIDTGDEAGLTAYDGLMAELADRYAPAVSEQVAVISGVRERAEQLANAAGSMADACDAAGPNDQAVADFLRQAAAVCRLDSQQLRDNVVASGESLATQFARLPIARIDVARDQLSAPLAKTAGDLSALARELETIERGGADRLDDDTMASVRRLRRRSEDMRDSAARAVRDVDDLKTLAVLTVARVLEQTSAVLVIGPPDGPGPGATAIDFASMFPPPMGGAGGSDSGFRPDERHRAEQLIVTALTSLSRIDAPTVVFVHAEQSRFPPNFPPLIRPSVERLRLRGIETLEWAVTFDGDPPQSTRSEATTVYVVIPTFAIDPKGSVRMSTLANVTDRLIRDGESVLLSVAPSTLPGYGHPDPMVQLLEPWGLNVDSGRPLIEAMRSADATVVIPDLTLAGDSTEHPISAAIRGLTLRLPWPTPIDISGPVEAGTDRFALLTIDRPNVWGESEWLGFAELPADQRTALQQQGLVEPPDAGERDNTERPWAIAVAAQRRLPVLEAPQRLVVVGCRPWFSSRITGERVQVGARRLSRFPGNLELLEASVYWLAGQDELVATSAEAAAVPTIRPMSDGALRGLRWVIVAGLPLCVLLVGAVWRLVRG